MFASLLDTHHASAERTDDHEIRAHLEQSQKDATLSIVLDAMPQHIVVLDWNRQVVTASTKRIEILSPSSRVSRQPTSAN